MEDVDLGRDRSHLIELIYGKNDGSSIETPMTLSETSTRPLKEKKSPSSSKKKLKEPSKPVTCSKACCILLFLVVLASIAFAAFAAYYITSQELSKMEHRSRPLAACHNGTHKRPFKPLAAAPEDADENVPAVPPPTKKELELPKAVKPLWYKVDIENGGGVATMKVKADEPTDKIVLNAAPGMQVTKSVDEILLSSDAEEEKRQKRADNKTKSNGVRVKSVDYDERLEKLVLHLDKKLDKGAQVVVKIPFSTKDSSSSTGLKEYKYDNGKKSMLTAPPTGDYMRRVFPSFDDPSFAAPAALSLKHPKSARVVANVGIGSSANGTTTLVEADRPDFVIGELEASRINVSSTPVRVWTRPEVKDSAKFAIDNIGAVVEAVQKSLGSHANTQGLDIVAVPGYEKGSRISSGFIVIAEEDILLAADNIQQKARVIRQLANRVAEQSFVNSSNWLRSAVPRYVEVAVLESVLHVSADDVWSYEMEKVLERDAMVSHRALSEDATDADKGAAVLRMLMEAIGVEDFNKVMKSIAASDSDDVQEVLKSSSKGIQINGWNNEKLDVAKFVSTWSEQIGFPLVSIEDLDESTVELSQERFKNDNETPEKLATRNAKYWFNWEVPLFSTKPIGWLHEAFRMPKNDSDVIIFNANANGVYRVDYGQKRWDEISKKLEDNEKSFNEKTRARILADVFTLADAKMIPFETALNMTNYLKKETHPVPWLIASEKLLRLIDRLEGTTVQDRLNDFIANKIEPEFQRISSDNDAEADYIKSLMRQRLFELMSRARPENANTHLSQLFQDKFVAACGNEGLSSKCSQVPGDLRASVYCNGIEFGNDTVYSMVHKLAMKETDENERETLLSSLACSRDPRTLRRLISNSLESSATVAARVLRAMNRRPVGRQTATNYIIDNWNQLKKRFNPSQLDAIVSAGVLVDNEREKSTIETLLDAHKRSTSNVAAFDEKLESATSSVYWRRQRANDIRDYLDGKMRGPVVAAGSASSDDSSEDH